eukprot:357857_1
MSVVAPLEIYDLLVTSLYNVFLDDGGKSISTNDKYQWKMQDELFTDIEIEQQFNITRNALPKPILLNTNISVDYETIKRIVLQKKWQTIPVHSKKNNKERKILKLSTSEFKRKITSHNNLKQIAKLIPIVRINKYNQYWIEYIWVVKITGSINIAISLYFNCMENRIEIAGIHLNKEYIIKSHELIPFHNCDCLDNFVS